MLKVIDIQSNVPEINTPFKFPLDPFQKHAIYAISKDENVLVTAKTGSGKTLVGEFQIYHSLAKGKRVFYTTPIKSLSNQKFDDLKKMFPSVGIMTGDIKFMPQAQIVIMTTEILRNLLYKKGTSTEHIGLTADLSLQDLDSVIFDEVHYINDPNRGKIWEECLTLLDPSVNLVLLSATIEKPELFASWLGELKQRPVHLISTQYRIVPLKFILPNGNALMNGETFQKTNYLKFVKEFADQEKKKAHHKEAVKYREDDQVIKKNFDDSSFLHRMNETIDKLAESDKLPALFFVLSRKLCGEYARKVQGNFLTSSEGADVRHIIKFHLHKYPDLQVSEQYFDLFNLLEKGVAYHHSGVLPMLKEIVEILFARGFVKVLFATETFAVGLNMPTKTVVFTSFCKKDEIGLRMLRPDEFTQMAGRAGRRGKDTEGIVMYLPRAFPDPPFDVEQMMIGKKPTINSQLEFHYAYILQSASSSKNVINDSFWSKQKQESIRILENDLKDRKPIRKLTLKEIEDCYEFEQIQGNQKLLNKFNNSHMGPAWKETLKIYKENNKELSEVIHLKEQIHLLKQEPPEIATRKLFLQKFEYLKDESPTFLGTLASEIYEANSLLMSYAFYSKMFHELTAEELVVVLAVFMESSDEDPPFDLCDIPYKSLFAIKELVKYSEKLQTEEILRSDYVYWKLSSGWTEIACLWLQNETSKNICSEFQMYEGEFVKGILKLSSLLEEWKHLASLAEDNEMLDKLKDVQLIREIAVPDSLYLR